MRKRNKRIQIWINEEELSILQNKSSKCGVDQSTFIRNIILGYNPKEKPDKNFYDTMKVMRGISNNLNQITAKAHSLGYIDEVAYAKECQKWNEFMLDIKTKYLN